MVEKIYPNRTIRRWLAFGDYNDTAKWVSVSVHEMKRLLATYQFNQRIVRRELVADQKIFVVQLYL